MKRQIALLPLMLVIALFTAGCASQIERAYTSRTVFNAALQDLITAKQTGAVNDAQYATAVATAKQISPILDQLDDAAINDRPIDFETLYSPFRNRLRDFLIQSAVAKKKGR